MPRKVWMLTNTPPKCKLSTFQKEEIKAKAQKFLDEVFKAVVIRPAPADAQFNYMVDVSVKWHGAYLIFMTKYACPAPNAFSPFFEVPLARFGYFSRDKWSVWARRHNDQWMDMGGMRLTLEGCFDEMLTNPWFNAG
jgi:hypothetical protein